MLRRTGGGLVGEWINPLQEPGQLEWAEQSNGHGLIVFAGSVCESGKRANIEFLRRSNFLERERVTDKHKTRFLDQSAGFGRR